MAERGLRQLDGDQGDQALPSRLGQRVRRGRLSRGRDGPGRAGVHSPDRPASPHRRAGQSGVRRNYLFQGPGSHHPARRLCRVRRVAAWDPRLCEGSRLPQHAHRRSVAGGRSGRRQGPNPDGARLYASAWRPSDPGRRRHVPGQCDAGHPRAGRVFGRPEVGQLPAAELARSGSRNDGGRSARDRRHIGTRDADDGTWLRRADRQCWPDGLFPQPLSAGGRAGAARLLQQPRPARPISGWSPIRRRWPKPIISRWALRSTSRTPFPRTRGPS